jgi:predicted lysophospholipase L1 biosynthesis ABC-type transport system permease subunit
MSDTYQKKYYSSKETDKAIEKYAKKNGLGYSEAIREMVMKVDGLVNIKVVSGSYAEYKANWPNSEIDIRG